MWGITANDLDVFEREVRELWLDGGIPQDPRQPAAFHRDPNIGPSIYQVTEFYIKPRTLASGTSWALMRNPHGLQCDVFVTHCWAEGVFEFTSKVRRMWPHSAKHLYCCFLSNPQNGDISALLGTDPTESPFALALATSKYLLVVPNRHISIYTRLWCVLEMHLARKRGLRIRMPTFPGFWPAAKALLPGSAVFATSSALSYFLCCVIFFQQWVRIPEAACKLLAAWTLVLVPCGALVLSLFAHTAGNALTRAALAFLGLSSGLNAFWVAQVDVLRKFPFAWWNPSTAETCCEVIPQVALMVLSLTYAVRSLLAQVLAEEGLQLTCDVRGATCSDAQDEERLRRAIEGSEDDIEETIRILMAAGKYSPAVAANLSRGLSASRNLYGVMPSAVVAGWCSWTVALAGCACEGVLGTCSGEMWALILCATVTTSAAAVVLSCWLRDTAIFATDVLLWSGLLAYSFQSLTFLSCWLTGLAHALCLSCAVFACSRFYCRGPAPHGGATALGHSPAASEEWLSSPEGSECSSNFGMEYDSTDALPR